MQILMKVYHILLPVHEYRKSEKLILVLKSFSQRSIYYLVGGSDLLVTNSLP
jgi:hypothetical protein